MTPAQAFSIFALVSQTEQACVAAAAAQLTRTLSEASGKDCICDCVFIATGDEIATSLASPLLVTSFLAELDQIDEPWPDVERRLRVSYGELTERGWTVFLCTAFRSVPPAALAEEDGRRRLLKIRRLNLLAAKLSQEFGLFVVDLDRAFADLGAQTLQTDYRLGGALAAEIAGRSIALTLITNGLDELVPFELQDAAKALLTASNHAAAGLGDRSAKLVGSNVIAIGRGRRKQVAATRVETLQDKQADRLVSLFLKGQISPKDAFNKLVSGVRNRGLGPSVRLIAASVTGVMRRKAS